MPQSAQITAAVQRCNEAWQKVRSQLPPDAGRHAQADNNELCRWAFLDQLPILCNPESFQTWIACIAQGVVLGVIDLADAGRYCHLAHSAIAAWRLANPPQKKEKHTPLPPPNGNHVEGENHPSAPEPGAPGPSHLGTRERCRDDANHPSAKPEGTPPPPPPLPPPPHLSIPLKRTKARSPPDRFSIATHKTSSINYLSRPACRPPACG